MNSEQINITASPSEEAVVNTATSGQPSVEPKEYVFNAPEEGDTTGWDKVYSEMGRPKNAKEYKYEIQDKLVEHLPVELLEQYGEVFHKSGLSQQAVSNLMQFHQEQLMEHITSVEAEQARLDSLTPEEYLAHVYPDEAERQAVGEGVMKAEEHLGTDFMNGLVEDPAFDTPDAHKLIAKVGEHLASKAPSVAEGSGELVGAGGNNLNPKNPFDMFTPGTPAYQQYKNDLVAQFKQSG